MNLRKKRMRCHQTRALGNGMIAWNKQEFFCPSASVYHKGHPAKSIRRCAIGLHRAVTPEQLPSISEEELQIIAQDPIQRAAKEFAPLKLALDYETCWELVAIIQLAMRRPGAPLSHAGQAMRQMAERIAQRIATTPELQEIVRRGWEQRT